MRPITPGHRGLGLRPEFVDTLLETPAVDGVDFLEIAPENWMHVGGRKRDQLDRIAGRYPLVAHGLSLSIGDTQPLNTPFVREVRRFLDDYHIDIYSDHLSASRDGTGYLYDLLPIPRRAENLDYLAGRIRQVQDITGRQLVLENISAYHGYPGEMPEGAFLAELAGRCGCGILLDINNAYVNARNRGTDVRAFLAELPTQALVYYHIAGHLELGDGMLLDTHGTPVADAVMRLAREVWATHGPRPLLLERDNFVPALDVLLGDLDAVAAVLREGEDRHVHA
ncbi:DUF692 domain-containing protein [Nitrospirillum pindoramense]|uniref:Uncharacterized protein n=1 Tax=Nitrospirillum amazonense TaxID=28077 RepID=A0A560GVP8_9PROT|nr:DUF692 domain-containing protein [Nitrospirillum amazonense]TWB38107.1 hypothetical protein FBZ90_113100 [Nitrospirillum amazonense]